MNNIKKSYNNLKYILYIENLKMNSRNNHGMNFNHESSEN